MTVSLHPRKLTPFALIDAPGLDPACGEKEQITNSKTQFTAFTNFTTFTGDEEQLLKLPNSKAQDRLHRIRELIPFNDLNSEEKEHVEEIIASNVERFHLPQDLLPCTDAAHHHIPTTDNAPIHVKQYRYPPIHREEIDRQVKDLLEKNIIQPSRSPSLWIVPKKSDAQGRKRRLVMDYKSLNEKTIRDSLTCKNGGNHVIFLQMTGVPFDRGKATERKAVRPIHRTTHNIRDIIPSKCKNKLFWQKQSRSHQQAKNFQAVSTSRKQIITKFIHSFLSSHILHTNLYIFIYYLPSIYIYITYS